MKGRKNTLDVVFQIIYWKKKINPRLLPILSSWRAKSSQIAHFSRGVPPLFGLFFTFSSNTLLLCFLVCPYPQDGSSSKVPSCMSRMVPAHLTGCFCLPDQQAFFLSELSSHFMAVFSHCGHVASVAAPITGTTYSIMQETLSHRNRIWVWNGQQHRCIRVTKRILLFSSGSERPFQREFDTVLSLQHAQHNKRLIFGEKI